MSGRITSLITQRGYGFITGDEGGLFFFHAREVHGVPFHWLAVGARVTFKPASDSQRGQRAHYVEEAL